jgi:hypothetical protein
MTRWAYKTPGPGYRARSDAYQSWAWEPQRFTSCAAPSIPTHGAQYSGAPYLVPLERVLAREVLAASAIAVVRLLTCAASA